MRRHRYFFLLLFWGATLTACGAPGGPAPAHTTETWDGVSRFDRVVMVVLENTDYDAAARIPYFQKLAGKGALFTRFLASTHPSYPNYIGMVAGDTYSINTNQQRSLKARSIAELLEAKGLTWKNYAEGYPGDCFLGEAAGNYRRKHVPFLSFTAVQSDPRRCANVVNADEFETDVSAQTLPAFAFYSPDLKNSGHDTGVKKAAAWLEGFLDPLLADESLANTLFIVTFDEAGNRTGSNRILTLFLGRMVQPGYVETAETNFYNVLRTIEEDLGLGQLGMEDSVNGPLTALWQDPAAPR